MEQNSTPTLNIKFPLWGGKQKFGYGKKEPWAGLAVEKMVGHKRAKVVLSFYPSQPTLTITPSAVIERATQNGWTGRNGPYTIVYVPVSELLELSEDNNSG